MGGEKGEKKNRQIIVTDPMTDKIMCRIRNPKMQISGYTKNGGKCVNLQKFMRESNITPDFGFDADEPIVEVKHRTPWSYMSNIILPKCR